MTATREARNHIRDGGPRDTAGAAFGHCVRAGGRTARRPV